MAPYEPPLNPPLHVLDLCVCATSCKFTCLSGFHLEKLSWGGSIYYVLLSVAVLLGLYCSVNIHYYYA